MRKENHEKDQEKDQKVANIMTQFDIFSKNFIGAGSRSVNDVGVACANFYEAMFKLWYNEEVDFFTNKRGGYRANYRGRVVTKVGIGMSAGEIMIESGGIVAPLGKKEMGRSICMFFPMIVKTQKILRVENMRICILVF